MKRKKACKGRKMQQISACQELHQQKLLLQVALLKRPSQLERKANRHLHIEFESLRSAWQQQAPRCAAWGVGAKAGERWRKDIEAFCFL